MTTRRQFVSGLTAAGASSFVGMRLEPASAEPPPETTTLRLIQVPSICRSPQYVAEPLLRSEGFTDVRYVRKSGSGEVGPAVASGEIDISMGFVGPLLMAIDQGQPLVILGPGHVGCFELFGNDRVRAIRDLKGKRVAIPAWGTSSQHTFVAAMVSYVGLDPRKDIDWVTTPPSESLRLFMHCAANASESNASTKRTLGSPRPLDGAAGPLDAAGALARTGIARVALAAT